MVDNNENKYWDEADFQNDVFAEDSYVFYKVVVVRPLWDTNENWDLKDTRTLDSPKGAISPAVTPNPVTSTPAENSTVPVDSNNKEI